MSDNLKSFLEIKRTELVEKGLICKGLFFRGYSSIYYKDGEIAKREGFRLLKRKSCKGGDNCKSWDGKDTSTYNCDCWFLEQIDELLPDDVIMPGIEDGYLYSIRVINETYDFESGYCDGFEVEFYKV